MGFVAPADIAKRARQVETDGWDGIKIYDTQCLFADAFVMTTAAGLATEKLKLSLSTSNPVTRHPSVAASAFAGLSQMMGQRFYYGIGRGDSSLAYIGGAPAPLGMFERYLTAVRLYLSGQQVPFDLIRDWQISSELSSIQLGHAPEQSSLRFLKPEDPVVPIEVYATGPKVLAIAGRRGDRVALGLGGDIERLRWAIGLARAARAEAGLDPSTLSFSSVVPVGVSQDIGRARRSVANMVASSARFSVINGKLVGPATDSQKKIYENILKVYDMSNHGGSGAQTDLLTDEFIDSFAIVGTPEMCVDRILELTDAGIGALMLAPPQGDADPQDIADGYDLLIREVIPAVRDRLRR
jgi:5,10-methylenetetrahydromethanopterin reductase